MLYTFEHSKDEIAHLGKHFATDRVHYLTAAADTAGQERLQRLIDSTDKQIDALVYELYGLTPEEIAVVENASR